MAETAAPAKATEATKVTEAAKAIEVAEAAPEKKVCNICGAESTVTEESGGPFEPANYCAKHAPKPAAKRR